MILIHSQKASLHGCGWSPPENTMLNTGNFSLKLNHFQRWGGSWGRNTAEPKQLTSQTEKWLNIARVMAYLGLHNLFPRDRSSRAAFLLFSTKNTDSGHFQGRSPQITDFRLVYARSEIWNNSGCQRLQKWTFTTTAHKLEVARVRVLGADQKKSWLRGRDEEISWHSFTLLWFWVFFGGSSLFKTISLDGNWKSHAETVRLVFKHFRL